MSFLKVVEGFGFVAGLNEENENVIFMEGHHYDDYESGRCGFSVNEFSLFDAYQRIIAFSSREARHCKRFNDGRYCSPYFYSMDRENITDVMIAEASVDDQYLGTKEQYEKHERERRREELESSAKELASKFKVKLSSLEFIEKLHEAIRGVEYQQESWNNPERRAEEWAACMYSGGGSEVYYDDLNFENGRYHERMEAYYDILEWLEEECPLLMCKYQEMRMKEKESED